MSTKTALFILRIVLGVVLVVYSAQMIGREMQGRHHLALLALAVVELIAAVLFLIPRTMRGGGIVLFVVFAVAVLFHVLHGEYNVGNLAVYAAAALAILSGGKRG